MAAMKGYAPEFTKDGYVKEEVFKVFGGFFKETVEYWNSFELSKDGKDTVSVMVDAMTQLHPKVEEKVKEGVAQVSVNGDGSKRVTYRGTDRGAYLERGGYQGCGEVPAGVAEGNRPKDYCKRKRPGRKEPCPAEPGVRADAGGQGHHQYRRA